MRENALRAALERGEAALGLMALELATPGLARIARAAGAGFVLYDQEHTGWGTETIRRLVETARAAGVTALVRVPDATRRSVSGVLDLGVEGVMVPMVERAEEARLAVDHARYPPRGSRGVGLFYPDELEPEGLPATLAKAAREVLVIVQIETVAGVERAEEICAVDGVDVIWIGHYDLTASLGCPGAFWSPPHEAAVARVLGAAAAAGRPVATLANDVDDARDLLARGFRMVALSDVGVLGRGLGRELGALRG